MAKQIATRIKARRLELNLTQEGIATRAGLKFATYRRFEQTGEISLKGLLQIGFALNALSEFDALFAQKQYQSSDDVLTNKMLSVKEVRKMNNVKQIEVIYDNRLVRRLALTKGGYVHLSIQPNGLAQVFRHCLEFCVNGNRIQL